MLVNPIQERVQRWSEQRFQKNLFLLRDDLPEVVRDMRETASLGEMLDEILARVDRGVRAIRSAAIVNGCVMRARGLSIDEVEAWRSTTFAQDYKSDICEPSRQAVSDPRSADPQLRRGRADRLSAGRSATGRLDPQPRRAEGAREVREAIARAIRTVIKREARELKSPN